MGSTINRYIFKEMLVPFLLGLGVFTFVLLIARILKLVDLVVNRGVPAVQILQLFSYILPAFLELTVPMALLLSILVALGRLSADSEIVALKASGRSLYQLAAPVLLFSLLAAMITLALAVYVRPWGNSRLKAGLYEVAKSRASVGLRERVFNADFPGLVIYVEEVVPPGNTFEGVLISDTRHGNHRSTAFARRGVLVNNEAAKTLTLRLLDGHIESTLPGKRAFYATEFAIYDINLDWGTALSHLKPRGKDPKEMTLPELRHAIARKQQRRKTAFAEQVEVHRKFSIPFACLVFAAVGIPLGLQSSRGVRSRAFSTSLVLIFVYYVLLSFGEDLGNSGSLPPLAATWLPNGVLGLGGACLFFLAARETRLALPAGRDGWISLLRTRRTTGLGSTG